MSQVPSPSTTFSASRPPSVPLSLNAPRFRLVTSSNFSAADSRQRITQPPPDYLTGSVPLSAQYIVSTSDAIMQRPRMSPVIRTQLPDVNSPVASNVSSSIMMSQPASTLQSTPQSNFTVTPRASGADNDQAVAKCARFFKTLLHLSEKQQYNNQQSPDTVAAVRQLIRGVVFGALPPEEFTVQLQKALKSTAQKNLLPFLRQTLPALRTAIQNGELVIEGVGTADEYEAEMAANKNSAAFNEPSAKIQPKTSNVEAYSLLDSSIDGVIYNKNDSGGDGGNVSIANNNNSACLPTTATSASLTTMPPPQPPVPTSNNDGSTNNGLMMNVLTNPMIPEHFQPTFLNAQALANRIFAVMPECEGVDEDVLTLISNVVEAKLRTLIAQLSVAAEHRLEPLRLNPCYSQIDEPKKQLRFMENIDRQAHEKRENLEREALLKFSKSKGKDKDTMEKVKQIQKADKEAALNREANEAAIAALGGSLGRTKRPLMNSSSVFQQNASAGISLQTHRLRIKRVTMRDLQYAMSSDTYTSSTMLYHKICYTNLAPTQPSSSSSAALTNSTTMAPGSGSGIGSSNGGSFALSSLNASSGAQL